MKKTFLGVLICLLSSVATHAQVGYQVSLLNSATGEPRANETVSANIEITDSKGGIVYSATQSATTNDFGVLSLVVGDADTFKDVAIGKLPLSIAVTVGGALIGKSQILNVPVAEVAKLLKSDFTLEELCGKTWTIEDYGYEELPAMDSPYAINHTTSTITFYVNGTCTSVYTSSTTYPDYPQWSRTNTSTFHRTYEIEGNTIIVYDDDPGDRGEGSIKSGYKYYADMYRFRDSKLYKVQ